MPYRRTPIIVGEIYHVFNRSVAKQPIFSNNRDYQRAIELLDFYSHSKPRLRFSHFNRLPQAMRTDFLEDMNKNCLKQICLLSFCLMPNHFHFLIKETIEKGISNFMRNFQNSYARYFNVKNKRDGALVQSMFKIVRIESEEQLLHVCRYIHLNPLSSYICKDINGLKVYRWSSLIDYMLGKTKFEVLDLNIILGYFPSLEHFMGFTFDQADYQKELENIKHLILE